MLVTRTGANLHKYIDIYNTHRLRGCMQFYRHAGALEAEASRGGRTHNGSGGAVRHSVLVWQFGSVTWSVCVTCWGPPLSSSWKTKLLYCSTTYMLVLLVIVWSSSIKNNGKQPGCGRSLLGILNWGTRTNRSESEIERYTEKCSLWFLCSIYPC